MNANLPGRNSYSSGTDTVASGDDSHAEGVKSAATHDASHAEGYNTKASGVASHAEGSSSTASGNFSHAEGLQTSASGLGSHAEGAKTNASASASHVEGNESNASGTYSHAEGLKTSASGDASHAEGNSSTASGLFSHAEGTETTASGNYTHAEGYKTTASGSCSHAQGICAKATRLGQHAQGGSVFIREGDAQSSVMTLAAITTDDTSCIMTVDGGVPSCGDRINVFTLEPGATATFALLIAARAHDADEVMGWHIRGLITRPMTSGDARIVGIPTFEGWQDTAGTTAAWQVDLDADTADHYLKIAVTGEIGKTIGWIARLTTAELIY
jgi:hypothetical protein